MDKGLQYMWGIWHKLSEYEKNKIYEEARNIVASKSLQP